MLVAWQDSSHCVSISVKARLGLVWLSQRSRQSKLAQKCGRMLDEDNMHMYTVSCQVSCRTHVTNEAE